MEMVSTEEFQRRIGHYLARALVEPMTITSNDKERLVMMSVEEYRRLKRRDCRVMTLDDFKEEDLETIRNVEAPIEAAAFNHEVGGVNVASDSAAVIREDRRKDSVIALAEEECERMAVTRPDFKEYLRRPVGLDELDLSRDQSLGRDVPL